MYRLFLKITKTLKIHFFFICRLNLSGMLFRSVCFSLYCSCVINIAESLLSVGVLYKFMLWNVNLRNLSGTKQSTCLFCRLFLPVEALLKVHTYRTFLFDHS